MTDNTAAGRLWPLFNLILRTPRIELRYANDDLLEELSRVATDVIPPGARPFDGDATFYDPSPAGRQRWVTGQWAARSRTSPSWWVLVFAVIVEGRAVGTQDLIGNEFPRLRTVGTFSWLTRSHQGLGIGKEMRQAVLHLAFEGLGASRAESEAFEDNAASIGVSTSLGYERNGTTWTLCQDDAAPMTRLLLTQQRWEERRRSDITI